MTQYDQLTESVLPQLLITDTLPIHIVLSCFILKTLILLKDFRPVSKMHRPSQKHLITITANAQTACQYLVMIMGAQHHAVWMYTMKDHWEQEGENLCLTLLLLGFCSGRSDFSPSLSSAESVWSLWCLSPAALEMRCCKVLQASHPFTPCCARQHCRGLCPCKSCHCKQRLSTSRFVLFGLYAYRPCLSYVRDIYLLVSVKVIGKQVQKYILQKSGPWVSWCHRWNCWNEPQKLHRTVFEQQVSNFYAILF